MAARNDKFLLVKGKAGLGNRMLSALTGILYSHLTQRRLVIDWGDETYSHDGSNVFPKLFDCLRSEPLLSIPATTSVLPTLWQNRLMEPASKVVQEVDPAAHDSQRRFRGFSIDLRQLDRSETVLVFCSYNHGIPELRKHFSGEFVDLAKKSDEEILTHLLRTALVLHPDIRTHVAKWHEDRFVGGRMIGVHVRFMDRRSSIDSFFREVDRLVERVRDPIIFLATDNRNAESAFKDRYKDVISTEKWFPASGVSMHQNPDCPDKLKSAIEALTDMYLLAKCDYLVYPGSSTFSYISSLVTEMSRENIIDVERRDPIIQLKKLARRWL